MGFFYFRVSLHSNTIEHEAASPDAAEIEMSQQHDQLDDGKERHLLPDLNPPGKSDCMEKTECGETPRQRKAAEESSNGCRAA